MGIKGGVADEDTIVDDGTSDSKDERVGKIKLSVLRLFVFGVCVDEIATSLLYLEVIGNSVGVKVPNSRVTSIVESARKAPDTSELLAGKLSLPTTDFIIKVLVSCKFGPEEKLVATGSGGRMLNLDDSLAMEE